MQMIEDKGWAAVARRAAREEGIDAAREDA